MKKLTIEELRAMQAKIKKEEERREKLKERAKEKRKEYKELEEELGIKIKYGKRRRT